MQSGRRGLNGKSGGGGAVVAKSMGDSIEKATRRHEGVTGGDRKVEESGGGVFLGFMRR